jgi:hypothetical protein
MNAKTFLKVVIHVSADYAYLVREILSDVEAGKTAEYEYYTFSIKGTRRSRSLKGPRALMGQTDEIEHTEEERIETFIETSRKNLLLTEIQTIEPHIDVMVDFYRVEDSSCLGHF